MPEHGAIRLGKDVSSDLDVQVGPYAENVPVVCGVMQLAKGETVRDRGLALRVPVREDMRGVQKLTVAKTSYRATFPVGFEDSFPKTTLMNSMQG